MSDMTSAAELADYLKILLLFGFAPYTLVFWAWGFVRFSGLRESWDHVAVKVFIFGGILNALLVMPEELRIQTGYEVSAFWYRYLDWPLLIETLIILILTQLLWFKPLRKKIAYRLVSGILTGLPLYLVLAQLPGFRGEFLSTSWSWNLGLKDILLWILSSLLAFLVVSVIFLIIANPRDLFIQNKRQTS